MSHFYGVISRSSRKNKPTACGTISTGLQTEAQSYSGKIVVSLVYDDELGKDTYVIRQAQHLGEGVSRIIAHGIIGE
jgi:hypothetical protein